MSSAAANLVAQRMSPAAPGLKNATCALCRRRKVRCDGRSPCARCSKAKIPVVCTYAAEPISDRRPQLPKGAACLPCRKRKRRCDGNVPCLGCASLRPQDCQYQYDFWTEELTTKPIWRIGTEMSSTNASHLTELDLNSDSTEEELSTVLDFRLQFMWSENTEPTGSSGSALSFIRKRPPLYGAPTSRVSPMCLATELSNLRNIFLVHCWQYGLNVTPEKRDALSRGDTLGLVHPALINICQLVGYFLAPPGTWICEWGQTEGEAEEARAVTRFLDAGHTSLDTTTSMQVHTMFMMYYAIKGDITMRVALAQRMQAVYLDNPVDIYPDESAVFGLPSLSACCPHSPAEEARSAFSRMMSVEIVGMLLFREEPIFDPLVRDTFRQLTVTNRTDTEMNFLHAKSALLLLDSRQVVEEWDPAHSDHIWSKRYQRLIEELTTHLAVAKTPLLELSFIHPAQILTLKTCILMALAALANLHALFAPFRTKSRLKHAEVVDEIALISSTFVQEDYRYFEATISVAWVVALRSVRTGAVLTEGGEFQVDRQAPSRRSVDIIRGCNGTFAKCFPFVLES